MEVDNGTCISFTDYPFDSTGLKKAKDFADFLMRGSIDLQSIIIYNPENQIIFEAKF